MPRARGGARAGAGKPPGTQAKATNEQKQDVYKLAREYTTTALEALVEIAMFGEGEQTRINACVALLDRGYGKPSQNVDMTTGGQPIVPMGLGAFYSATLGDADETETDDALLN